MRSSVFSSLRLVLHFVLLALLFGLVQALSISSPSVLAADGRQLSVGLYVGAKTTLLGLLLFRLADVAGERGSQDGRAVLGGLGEVGLGELEKWACLVGGGLWAVAHVRLLQVLRSASTAGLSCANDTWVARLSGATVAVLLAQCLLHVLHLRSDSTVSSERAASVEKGEKTAAVQTLPQIVITPADSDALEAQSDPTPSSNARVGARSVLVENTVVLGLLLGATISVGLSAVVITAILGYQPATPLLLPVVLSIGLILWPSPLSAVHRLSATTIVLLAWYPAALAFSVDHRGAPTCGIWDPHASATVRHFEPILCHLSRVVYYASWAVMAGMLLQVVDLHLCLADDDDLAADQTAGDAAVDDDLTLGDELRLLAGAPWQTLLAPVRALASCKSEKQRPIHLA